MRIVYMQGERQEALHTDKANLIIGRPKPGVPVDLDLTPDKAVSRPHARIWIEETDYWIEDLGSGGGTLLQGEQIKGRGRHCLRVHDRVEIGETTLWLEESLIPDSGDTAELPVASGITERDATIFAGAGAAAGNDARLALLLELPLLFAAQPDDLLETIVKRLVEVLPGAGHGALLLGDDLLLKASYPYAGFLSTTLARRAMTERKGFIWQRQAEPDLGNSIGELTAGQTAMYAPLLWQGRALGALCAHAQSPESTFGEDDLRLMLTVAQYAAMAVTSHQFQQELRDQARLLERLMTSFSPKVRAKLLEKAHKGRLRPGGERSEVVVLFADMRGFTAATSRMEAEDVLEMLNEYFPALTKPLFHYDGTIDKFIGDAVLAVFGSPEPDNRRHENAVRAALEMQKAVADLNRVREARGLLTGNLGIGIHSGDVLHGFVGTAEMLQFTVIGDTVNRADRYCAGANAGEVLVSQKVYERVWRIVDTERKIIATKHEGDLVAFKIKALKERVRPMSDGP